MTDRIKKIVEEVRREIDADDSVVDMKDYLEKLIGISTQRLAAEHNATVPPVSETIRQGGNMQKQQQNEGIMNASQTTNATQKENVYNREHWMKELYANDGSTIKEKVATVATALNGIGAICSVLRISAQLVEEKECFSDAECAPLKPWIVGHLEDGLNVLVELARDELYEVLSSDDFQELNSADRTSAVRENRLKRQRAKA